MVGLHERNLNTAPDAVDDLVLLRESDITEQGVVNDLRNRYDQDQIYTYIGPVLLSVNPFKEIRGLYTEQMMSDYYGRYKFEVAPHVFASAEEAHRKLMSTGLPQCVLISGESGAGKTEAAKKVMEYVSKVSSDSTEMSRFSKLTRTVAEIKDSLLKSNPVLEAFGNAKTIRNDNSSRFGKYMEIQMDYNGVPLGGRITNYLLEKPRVVHQDKGERSFHIFYLLTNGGGARAFPRLNLQSSSAYKYLCDPASAKVSTVDDAEWYEEMDQAMGHVGIDGNMKEQFYKMVSAILWLGNVQFEETKKGGQDACHVTTPKDLQIAAELLSVSPKDLEEALTYRSRETAIDKLKSPLVKVDECDKVRDALAKALYYRMFQLLVERINDIIRTQVSELSLGVLDIYGFEIFEHNALNQLFINFCNEKLQQYFIQLTLKAEQEEYRAEGIRWKEIQYFNNKIVCDLIEGKKPPGIIAYLDEQILLNRDEDLSFLAKMNKQISNPHYQVPPSNKSTPTEFVIKHYAGDVTYSAEGMIDMNKDTLFRDLLVLCGQKSKSAFVQEMFPEGKEKHDFKKPVTAGSQFVLDMNQLITNLEKCEPHYIRCIKPNDNKRANFFDEKRVLHQVKYLGLLENVRVRRAGYAYRRVYDLFVRRYKMLSTDLWPKPKSKDDRQNTQIVLNAVGVPSKEFEFGKTKIFIENPETLFTLEKQREKALNWVVAIIQKTYRAFKSRLYFQELRAASFYLLQGKKRRNNSWVLYFFGDYLFANNDPGLQAIMAQNGDRKVIFSDYITEHHLGKTRSTSQEKLIITDKSMIFMSGAPSKPNASANAKAAFTKNGRKGGKQLNAVGGPGSGHMVNRIPFDRIHDVSLSTFADTFISVNVQIETNPKTGKPILTPSVVFESVRKSEIATVFNEAYKAAFQRDAPLQFIDTQQIVSTEKKFLAKAKPIANTLQFYENPNLGGRQVVLDPQVLDKKNPSYDPAMNMVGVSPMLGSQAQLQLNTELPERIVAHTKMAHEGKKRYQGRRRKY